MHSRIYRGTVTHARYVRADNRFRYGIYYLYVDLDELDRLDTSLRRFGHNRRALVSVWDADHGPRDGSALRPWIDEIAARAGIDLAGGSVRLLTFPRVMGFRFYPVSFWYCFGADERCYAVLAEVQNTYRDHHNYLLHNDGEPFDFDARPTATKAFFVSPFIQLENVRHTFRFTAPGESLAVSIEDSADDERVLTASISLKDRPIDDAELLRCVRQLGPMSARALVLIHWQALRLLLKRVPLVPHTPPPAEETTL